MTAYRITPADAGGTVQDYTPTAPLGYVLSGDFTGRENGIRVMRWTSSQGDLLFEASPIGSPSVLVKRLDVAGA